MNFDRFSTSGLAWAHFDDLFAQGYVCAVHYRPRYERDPQPFLVEWLVPASPEADDDEAEEPQSWMAMAA